MDIHAKIDPAFLKLTPEERLQRRVYARYLKTAAGPMPFGNDEPGGEPMDVEAASAIPGGNEGGPGKRNIPKSHPYDPRALKPLSRMLWSMSVALGHALTAYRQFTKLKSSTISPDGMLGGRGYVQQVKEIRDKLHDACENLSAISDTIHDEINAPHWQPKMKQLPPEEAQDVQKFIDESQQILQNPEEEAQEDMDAFEEQSMDAEIPGGEDEAPEGMPQAGEPIEEDAITPEDEALADQALDAAGLDEGTPDEEPGDEEPGDDESLGGDDNTVHVKLPDGSTETMQLGDESEEEPTDEEAPPVDESEETPEDEALDEEPPTDEGDEEPPAEDTDEEEPPAGDTVDEEEPPVDEGEEPPTDEGEEPPVDEDEEEPPADDEEIAAEAPEKEPEESSSMPSSEEPIPDELGKPKNKKKKKKVPPGSAHEQKFSPEMRAFWDQPRMASVSYHRGNSSIPVDTLSGPRVNHLGPGEGRGPLDSYNTDDPEIDDNWGRSDGRSESDDYIYQTPWENDTSKAASRPVLALDTYRTIAQLLTEGWDERRILGSAMARRFQLDAEDIKDAALMQKRNMLAASDIPDSTDDDTATDAWDFGIGYGAEGQGAGRYENPSGEGSGTKGVYGPTSGLPTEHAGPSTDTTTPSLDVEVNERTNVRSTAVMPTDVEPPVARSDYYTEGLTDDMIATSQMPTPESNPYNFDRDLPNKSEMYEHHDTPYIRYDYTTHNYRPDPNYSRPER